MHNNNAAQWLIDRNIEQGYGEAIAVRFRRTTRSYADVMRATWRVQNTLRDLGVREGERVVVLANDGPDMVAWFLGCLRAGVIAVPVSPLLSGEQVGDVAREAGATLLVVSAPFRFFIDAAARRTPSLFQAVVIDDAGRLATSTIGGPTVVSWSDYGDDSPAPVSAVTSDGAAFHFYQSSGSKMPEALTRVVATHSQIHSQATKYVNILDHLSSTDRVYGLPKLHMPVGIECSLIDDSVEDLGVIFKRDSYMCEMRIENLESAKKLNLNNGIHFIKPLNQTLIATSKIIEPKNILRVEGSGELMLQGESPTCLALLISIFKK